MLGIASPERQTPTISVELDKELSKQSRKYRPGSVVKIVVVGSISSVNYRKPDDPDEKGYEGHMCMEIQKMELLDSAKNPMEELLDDED